MTDETNQENTENSVDETGIAPEKSTNSKSENRVDDLPDWAQDIIRSLRDESASRRVALKKEQEANRQREQERLAEEGKWRELADQRAHELAKLEPYKERAESLETLISHSNQKRLKSIPESMIPLVPTNYSPEQLSAWLDTNFTRLTKPTAPKIDGGATGSSSSTLQLTDDEKEVARASGLTFEDYAKYKERLNGG